MHGDDVHETREINGLWMRDSDYRARPIWIYSGHLLNLRKSNPLLLPYTFEKNYKHAGDVNKTLQQK